MSTNRHFTLVFVRLFNSQSRLQDMMRHKYAENRYPLDGGYGILTTDYWPPSIVIDSWYSGACDDHRLFPVFAFEMPANYVTNREKLVLHHHTTTTNPANMIPSIRTISGCQHNQTHTQWAFDEIVNLINSITILYSNVMCRSACRLTHLRPFKFQLKTHNISYMIIMPLSFIT